MMIGELQPFDVVRLRGFDEWFGQVARIDDKGALVRGGPMSRIDAEGDWLPIDLLEHVPQEWLDLNPVYQEYHKQR